MRKSLGVILSTILITVAFYTSAAIAAPIIYQKSRSLPAKTGGTIKVGLGSQDVAITTHPQHKVNITVTIRSAADSKNEKSKLIKKLLPTIKAQGNSILINSPTDDVSNSFFSLFGFHSKHVNSKVAIAMPADMNVNFKLGSGDFSFNANKAHTRINGRSGSGDIHIQSASHEMSLTSGSGDQRIKLAQPAKNVKLQAGSGDIAFSGGANKLKIGAGSGNIDATGRSAQAQLHAGSGDIDVSNLTGDLDVDTGSGDVTARFSKLSSQSHIAAEAGSGDVRLILPASAHPQGTLSTSSGAIDSDFPGSSNDHHRRFELSGSQPAVSVRANTGSGDIQLQKRG